MSDRKIDLESMILQAESSGDFESIFNIVLHLLDAKQNLKALEIINKNKVLLANADQIRTMEYHFYALIELERFVDAMNELSWYEELPYVNQETEERVQELKLIIKNASEQSKVKHKYQNKKKVHDILCYSKDEDEIFEVIQYIEFEGKIEQFKQPLAVLASDKEREISQSLKALVFSILIDNHINVNLVYTNGEYSFEVNPKDMTPIRQNEIYLKMQKTLDRHCKNITVVNLAKNILESFYLLSYPIEIIDEEGVNTYVIALYEIANKFLSDIEDLSEAYAALNVLSEDVSEAKQTIMDYLQKDQEPETKN